MKIRIRELREEHGLMQEALAREVDVTRQTTLFMDKGKYDPSPPARIQDREGLQQAP